MERILLKTPVEELESPLNGREIMSLLKIPSGPKIKEVKQFLCEAVIEGRLAPGDKESAHKLVLEKFGGERGCGA